MVAPDVQIEDGKGTILISSEEGETESKQAGDDSIALWMCHSARGGRCSCICLISPKLKLVRQKGLKSLS